jgi:hypothetical protein
MENLVDEFIHFISSHVSNDQFVLFDTVCIKRTLFGSDENGHFAVGFEISNFDLLCDDPIKRLVAHLIDRDAKSIEIRLELGMMYDTVPFWHQDSTLGRIMSFSNKDGWSTKFLTDTGMLSADPGKFYDNQRWHRSPIGTDVSLIEKHHYRVFARVNIS